MAFYRLPGFIAETSPFSQGRHARYQWWELS